ncbi:hypothetical protein BK708_25660 [Bacillus thuringiensis serovar yunnanensis]|nr:hypothetical protein BK708_25660 [Bacillus thuringiensis serovar yunnanensis]
MGVPFFGEGSEKVTVDLDVTYKKSLEETYENSTEVTFPSQTINCAPHGKTTFFSQVQETAFDGTYTGKAVIKSFDLKLNGDKKTISKDDIYDFYALKSGLMKQGSTYSSLPDSLEADESNKQILVKKHVVSFTGKAGHLSQAKVTFTPEGSQQKTVTMSLDEYNEKLAAGLPLFEKP